MNERHKMRLGPIASLRTAENCEPFRRGTTRLFKTVWSSSGELQINQIDAAKARGLPQTLVCPPPIVRRSAIRAARPATRRHRTGQRTDRATSRCHWWATAALGQPRTNRRLKRSPRPLR